MVKGLSKDFVFLFAGIFLSFALESWREALGSNKDLVSLTCLCLFALLIGGYLAFRYYHGVLAAGPAGSHGMAYDHLRAALAEGGNPAQVYAQWLEKALRRVERCFGEKAPDSPSFMQRAIGLHKSAALWTAPALDWCILFAFIYPQAFLILGWVITGEAGTAEKVLGLAQQPLPLPRYVTLGAIALAVIGYAKACETLAHPGREATGGVRAFRFALWLALLAAASLTIDQLLNHGKGAIGGSVILASAVVGAISGDVLVAVASGFAGAGVGVVVMLLFGKFSAAIAAALGCCAIGFLHAAFGGKNSRWARLRHRVRYSFLFWWVFLAGALCLDLGVTRLLSPSGAWPVMGPILIFYGLLPVLNAPFLWFSVGLTRALLWLGLERKGWWPFFYALLDAATAVVVIVLLVCAIVVGFQTLNQVAIKAGGTAVLDVAPLLSAVIHGFQTRSFKAEDWWVYTLMLSTMVPSLVNLAIGGFSLAQGIPLLSRYLHDHLPQNRPVASRDRNWVAAILSGQVVIGMCLGAIAQFVLLPWGIFGFLLPHLGDVVNLAQAVQKLNLPGQIWH